MTQKKYITTPIYYVNDIPHIGHAYNILATDTLARYWRKKIGKENVFFLTGTDENSQKTVDAAKKAGKTVEVYLDEMSANWKQTWEQMGMSFDDFIRTTEDRHTKVVQEVLQKIYDNGDIYKGEYKGLYCSGCETFLKDDDLDENGHCPDHKKAPEALTEENYFFKLSAYSEQLLELFDNDILMPQKRKNEMVSFINSGLEDISISREGAEIGIPFPFDETHKTYVWVEALINYRSACPNEDFWNNVTHLIGKDITKFHTVIWPAMLISAGITPPEKVFAHGFFTVNGTKMSKSLGNVINPLELGEKFGNDALRVGLLSSFEFGNDGDFSMNVFENLYRSKLAGGVGNLFNRVIILIHKFLEDQKPNSDNFEVKNSEEWKTFSSSIEEMKIQAAINFFFKTVDETNQLLNETEVWKIAKTDLKKVKSIFVTLLNKLEILAEMSEILLPESFSKMKKMLGNSQKVGKAEILFKTLN